MLVPIGFIYSRYKKVLEQYHNLKEKISQVDQVNIIYWRVIVYGRVFSPTKMRQSSVPKE